MIGALKKVGVIIPFYRDTISDYENIALQQCQKVLGNHPLIAIKPEHLKLPQAAAQLSLSAVVSFDNSYFESIAGYNKLMLSEEFYGKFLDYEYILIYQLDAFVFSDQLLHWCNQDIDYVGAPWLRDIDHGDLFKAAKSEVQYYVHTRYDVQKNGEPSPKQFENRTGNGGFSLRRVKKFYDITISRKQDIQKYLAREGKHQFNEDAFWSIEVNRKKKVLNIPDHKKAVGFAFENSPQRALNINKQQLPFGCHAWDRHVEFWHPIFKQHGYPLMQHTMFNNFKADLPVDIKCLYRISDAGNPKLKLDVATKMHCLDNFIKEFKNNIYVFADNCSHETIEAIKSRGIEPVKTSLGNSKSWRYVVERALENFDDNSYVYLIEDDYLHLPGSLTALQEGLGVADYVTLYDHPDKYLNSEEGPNPHIAQGGELSRVLLTKSTHWKHTNSTTMSFGVKVKTLREDKEIWWRFTHNHIPDDFHAFQVLTHRVVPEKKTLSKKIKGLIAAPEFKNERRVLISPIPGFATHAELDLLSPITHWHPIKSWEEV
ncbi:DUF5672 family protein [Mucilaginibacter sp. PAMB04168]|uniref:DUF5672 family protein n=1 Tax=Mucilaginibacter sp. PAMB04168 TaxID=3138567 RepID=UPI0031F65B01